ncbi:hypothetical protein JX266_013649 [Neoarthrinium moseri]|nr:hypothetical protein JX266_013649 [Neoarthrinium moseri]
MGLNDSSEQVYKYEHTILLVHDLSFEKSQQYYASHRLKDSSPSLTAIRLLASKIPEHIQTERAHYLNPTIGGGGLATPEVVESTDQYINHSLSGVVLEVFRALLSNMAADEGWMISSFPTRATILATAMTGSTTHPPTRRKEFHRVIWILSRTMAQMH